MVNHRPMTDTEQVCKVYSEKDGVPIKYVCTSSLTPRGRPFDVFFRETPHPEFGNRYFGIDGKYITNGDAVESMYFECLKGPLGWTYSQYVHDFVGVGDDAAIDGGREYTKVSFRSADKIPKRGRFKVRDGQFLKHVPEPVEKPF